MLMGSGETTPTMVTTHKSVLESTGRRTGHIPPRAVLLNTPYGFQENVGEITDKALRYFAHNVGQQVQAIDTAVIEGAPAIDVERALDAINRADWLFAGPGSPTYALRQWSQAPVKQALIDLHGRGGTVVFASAAAVTAGSHAIGVYEIYKAGHPAGWCGGLDLVASLTGWSCVVIPHFDNAEGGTHDTRFCYLGDRRLRMMEEELPADAWILGIDEHTACIIDSDSDSDSATVCVEGRGAVHVRRHGQVVFSLAAGHQVPMADLVAAATGAVTPPSHIHEAPEESTGQGEAVQSGRQSGRPPTGDPLIDQQGQLREQFDRAVEQGDADQATAAALATEQTIRDWSADSLVSDGLQRAVAQLRSMITRLGALAAEGMHDHTDLVRPHIETLLHVREDARARKEFGVADHIRGHMDADGVKVSDTPEGTDWKWDAPDP